jgi:hypothetical protein
MINRPKNTYGTSSGVASLKSMRRGLGERVDQQLEISTHRIEDRAGTTAFFIFFDFGFGFFRSA